MSGMTTNKENKTMVRIGDPSVKKAFKHASIDFGSYEKYLRRCLVRDGYLEPTAAELERNWIG